MVLTIRTNVAAERGFLHSVVAANGKARIGSDGKRWRLFDLKNNTITFVDDREKTFRTESLKVAIRKRRALLARPVPFIPFARHETTGAHRVFTGVPAHQHRITLGAYKRELWVSDRVLIDPEFFAMQLATEPVSEPDAGVMRNVFDRLITLQGFPVFDRSEMPYDGKQLMIERSLARMEQKRIPLAWITVPAGYRDLDAPATTPDAGRPPVSSTPGGRNTPGAE